METISAALANLPSNDLDQEFVYLSKATKILRKYMFMMENNFNGTFPPDCQKDSTQPVVRAFFQMVIDGPAIVKHINPQSPVFNLGFCWLNSFFIIISACNL